MKVPVTSFVIDASKNELVIETQKGTCNIKVNMNNVMNLCAGMSEYTKPKMDIWKLSRELLKTAEISEVYIKEESHGDYFAYVTINGEEYMAKPSDLLVVLEPMNIETFIDDSLLKGPDDAPIDSDPKVDLQRQIDEAVEKEDFDLAAKLQEELNNLN